MGELLGYGVSNCCGAITFPFIYAPKDSTYLITFSYMGAGGDNDGDVIAAVRSALMEGLVQADTIRYKRRFG